MNMPRLPFNNCIAIGVSDKAMAAARFTRAFEAEITAHGGDWIEVTAGPYRLYFVEDGTKDIAFSVDCAEEKVDDYLDQLNGFGFAEAKDISSRVGEPFVRDQEGILVNIYPVKG